MKTIDPWRDLRESLLRVEKPGRYVGGEFGATVKSGSGYLDVALSYPDLYEIGMSNLAVRQLYLCLNSLDSVRCERVFAPAPDFEQELRRRGVPLYSLESGRPLATFDIMGFSIGYELTLTNVLAILELGGIRALREKREHKDPIVIVGGPAVTNPVPYGTFADCVFVGEAEQWVQEAFPVMAELKSNGAAREDLLEFLLSQPAVWSPLKPTSTVKSVWTGFGQRAAPAPLPVPSIRTVQDHGVVEIMRGCPNGCRFCAAGVLYRPPRIKHPQEIFEEVSQQILACGYREITLSSLSSGDYPGLPEVVRFLNARFSSSGVSFSLPSLKMESFNVELLVELDVVRRSGLTFAIETPSPLWQQQINKRTSRSQVIDLLRTAKDRGWRTAKFYFMVGLPIVAPQDEAAVDEVDLIEDFLRDIRSETGLKLNVNVSTFVPKPHTPLQWAAQLSEDQALTKIMSLRRRLGGRGFKIRYHSPFQSFVEGVIARGDRRAGELVWAAYKRGARLDAWEDRMDRDSWRQVIDEAAWSVEQETCRARTHEERLPWQAVELGVKPEFLREEHRRVLTGRETVACKTGCEVQCGVCRRGVAPKLALPQAWTEQGARPPLADQRQTATLKGRVLFSFQKRGTAALLSHLDLMSCLERAFARAGYRLRFTEGYNPKPRIEFANPLALGIESRAEICAAEALNFDSPVSFEERLNRVLPDGVRVMRVKLLGDSGSRRKSPMSIFWGSDYLIEGDMLNGIAEHLAASESVLCCERRAGLRLRLQQTGERRGKIIKLVEGAIGADPLAQGVRVTRIQTLAVDQGGSVGSYFEVMV